MWKKYQQKRRLVGLCPRAGWTGTCYFKSNDDRKNGGWLVVSLVVGLNRKKHSVLVPVLAVELVVKNDVDCREKTSRRVGSLRASGRKQKRWIRGG
jgi:hypothetical protein